MVLALCLHVSTAAAEELEKNLCKISIRMCFRVEPIACFYETRAERNRMTTGTIAQEESNRKRLHRGRVQSLMCFAAGIRPEKEKEKEREAN